MVNCTADMISHRFRLHQLSLLLALAVLFSARPVRSQWVTTALNAIDVPADPRTIALGESFVALPANSMALMENPAGLSGLNGVGATFARRQFNWLSALSDARYYGAGAFLSTGPGTFAVLYNRFNLGASYVTSPFGPIPVMRTETHNHLLAIGFSRDLTEHLSAGIALKGYTEVQTLVEGNPGNFFYETTGSFMVDVGALYAFPQLFDLGPMENTLNAGLSIQNFGTDFRERTGDPSSPSGVQEYLVKLPRYVRIGTSCTLCLPATSPTELTPFTMTITGEYRGLLNPSENQESDRDFWGFGAEVSLLEIITGRIGGEIEPYTSIYGSRAVPGLRYGIAITVPFRKLGVDVPLRISVDYAGIPLTDRTMIFGTSGKSTLQAFSFQVVYTDAVF